MVLEHEGEHPSRWAAMVSIGGRTGCSPHTLREWVQKADRDSGRSPGVTSDVAAKLKALERENRQANEILRKGSTYSAQHANERVLKPAANSANNSVEL